MNIRKNHAFSLIELMLVLVVMISSSIAAIVIYNHVSNQYKLDKEVKNLVYLKSSIDSINNLDKINLNDTFLKDSGIISKSQINKNGDLVDAWGNPISISNYSSDKNYYSISYSDLSVGNCISLISNMKDAFKTITIGGTTITNPSATKISELCNSTYGKTAFVDSSMLGNGVDSFNVKNNIATAASEEVYSNGVFLEPKHASISFKVTKNIIVSASSETLTFSNFASTTSSSSSSDDTSDDTNDSKYTADQQAVFDSLPDSSTQTVEQIDSDYMTPEEASATNDPNDMGDHIYVPLTDNYAINIYSSHVESGEDGLVKTMIADLGLSTNNYGNENAGTCTGSSCMTTSKIVDEISALSNSSKASLLSGATITFGGGVPKSLCSSSKFYCSGGSYGNPIYVTYIGNN